MAFIFHFKYTFKCCLHFFFDWDKSKILSSGNGLTLNYSNETWNRFNPLLHRYSFWRINNRRLLKTLWEKKKLLITSNFSFSHNVFYSVKELYPHLSIFLTSYLYLLLKWKSLKLTYQVKGWERRLLKTL